MRALIVSDVHANVAAFEAVLAASKKERDYIICLGDLVGYGPDPGECVKLAMRNCDAILAGNHDLAACDRMDTSDFSTHARQAMAWTRSQLDSNTIKILENLPTKMEKSGFLISHGSPADPIWGYILSEEDASDAFTAYSCSVCIFGHTHVPSAFIQAPDKNGKIDIAYGAPEAKVQTNGMRALLNPGSVGFPRDAADAHSSDNEKHAAARYAIFDDETGLWVFRRVEYDMRATAKRMRKVGLW